MVNLNDLETLLQLLMLFKKYGKSIIVHDVFKEELVDLLAKSGSEDKFLKRFESYIRQIMENGDTAIGPPGMPIEHLAGQNIEELQNSKTIADRKLQDVQQAIKVVAPK